MVHLALEDGYQKLERVGGWTGHFRLARRDGDAMVSPARSLKNELESVEL
jgi:hypothetical protein